MSNGPAIIHKASPELSDPFAGERFSIDSGNRQGVSVTYVVSVLGPGFVLEAEALELSLSIKCQ
jgi:hypothetical protein